MRDLIEPPFDLSPLIFIIFRDKILKKFLRRTRKIRTGYWNMRPVYIQTFVCADDVVTGANNKTELQ